MLSHFLFDCLSHTMLEGLHTLDACGLQISLLGCLRPHFDLFQESRPDLVGFGALTGRSLLLEKGHDLVFQGPEHGPFISLDQWPSYLLNASLVHLQ